MDSQFDFDDTPDVLQVAWQRLTLALRPLRPVLTGAGGALAFDALVFVVIAMLVGSLLGGALGDEALYMLCGLVGFAIFWGSISGPDLQRFLRLQRRWMRRLRSAPPPAAPARVLRAPQRPPARALGPVAAQSAYRPMRNAAVNSLSLWRRPTR